MQGSQVPNLTILRPPVSLNLSNTDLIQPKTPLQRRFSPIKYSIPPSTVTWVTSSFKPKFYSHLPSSASKNPTKVSLIIKYGPNFESFDLRSYLGDPLWSISMMILRAFLRHIEVIGIQLSFLLFFNYSPSSARVTGHFIRPPASNGTNHRV